MMRDRLIELIRAMKEDATITCPRYDEGANLKTCRGCQYNMEDGSCDYAGREADYLLADGWMRPPCRVGDTLYTIENCKNRPEKIFVTAVHLYRKYTSITALSKGQKEYFYEDADFGKTVFLSKELKEAEAALKGGAECGTKNRDCL